MNYLELSGYLDISGLVNYLNLSASVNYLELSGYLDISGMVNYRDLSLLMALQAVSSTGSSPGAEKIL